MGMLFAFIAGAAVGSIGALALVAYALGIWPW